MISISFFFLNFGQIFSQSITAGELYQQQNQYYQQQQQHQPQHNNHQQEQQHQQRHQSFLPGNSLAVTTYSNYHHHSKKRRSVGLATQQLIQQQISALTYNEPQFVPHHHDSPTITALQSTSATTLKDGPVAEVIAIKEGADLDLACPISIRSFNDDMIFSWTCGDEPANVRSSRIHVTDSGKLRIRSARVGDSCNYRCEAVDGFGTVSVMVKVIIVDKKIIEQHLNKTVTPTEGSSETTRPPSQQRETVQAMEENGSQPSKPFDWAHSSTIELASLKNLREKKPNTNNQVTTSSLVAAIQANENNGRNNKNNNQDASGINTNSRSNNNNNSNNNTNRISDHHQPLDGRVTTIQAHKTPHILQLFALTKNPINVSRAEYPSIRMMVHEGASLILGCKFQANPWPARVRWIKDGLELPAPSRSSNGSSDAANSTRQNHYERYSFYNLTSDIKSMAAANESMPLNYSCQVSNYLGESRGNFLINILPNTKMDTTIKQQQAPSNNYLNGSGGSNVNFSRKVQLTPAFSYAEANTSIRLECSCNYSLVAPQIQWLKEYTGPRPHSLADAHNMGLIYLEEVYYHNLNWPRIISYQGRSFNSILVIKRAKSTHSGRYMCFAAYPPLNEPLRYRSASSQVFINDDRGNLISNGGQNFLPIVTDQQQRNYLKELVKSNSWETNGGTSMMQIDIMGDHMSPTSDRRGSMSGLWMMSRWPWWLVACILVTIFAIGFVIMSKRYQQSNGRTKVSYQPGHQEELVESAT